MLTAGHVLIAFAVARRVGAVAVACTRSAAARAAAAGGWSCSGTKQQAAARPVPAVQGRRPPSAARLADRAPHCPPDPPRAGPAAQGTAGRRHSRRTRNERHLADRQTGSGGPGLGLLAVAVSSLPQARPGRPSTRPGRARAHRAHRPGGPGRAGVAGPAVGLVAWHPVRTSPPLDRPGGVTGPRPAARRRGPHSGTKRPVTKLGDPSVARGSAAEPGSVASPVR